jgi:hypothetical protein
MSLGLSPRTEPTSDAHVSPQQQEIDPRQASEQTVGKWSEWTTSGTSPGPLVMIYANDAVVATAPLQNTCFQLRAVVSVKELHIYILSRFIRSTLPSSNFIFSCFLHLVKREELKKNAIIIAE